MIILYLLVNNSNGGDRKLIFLLLAIFIVFITIIFLLFRMRIYIVLNWQIDEEEKCLEVSARAFNIPLYRNKL